MQHSCFKSNFLVYLKTPTSDLDTNLPGLCFCGQLPSVRKLLSRVSRALVSSDMGACLKFEPVSMTLVR